MKKLKAKIKNIRNNICKGVVALATPFVIGNCANNVNYNNLESKNVSVKEISVPLTYNFNDLKNIENKIVEYRVNDGEKDFYLFGRGNLLNKGDSAIIIYDTLDKYFFEKIKDSSWANPPFSEKDLESLTAFELKDCEIFN